MAIKQEANRLKMKYQTTDPYDICTSMDIQVIKRPMGASTQSCKGFFLVSSRCKLIVINSDLPESILTQPEGFVTGMAAKMFTVAGPVITFGTLASVIYGVILMLLK